MLLQYGFYFVTRQLQPLSRSSVTHPYNRSGQRETAHAPCPTFPGRQGGTGLRPITSCQDESRGGCARAQSTGDCPRPGQRADPHSPMTQVPPGWQPNLWQDRGSLQRVGVTRPQQALEGRKTLVPSCPSWSDTFWVILLSNRFTEGSLRSTASTDVLPSPRKPCCWWGHQGLCWAWLFHQTLTGSPECITGRETKVGDGWGDLRTARPDQGQIRPCPQHPG